MLQNYEEFVKMVKVYYEGIKTGKAGFLFLETNNVTELCQNIKESVKKVSESEYSLFSERIDSTNITQPYFPFFSFLKERYKNYDDTIVKQKFKEAKIDNYSKKVFFNWIRDIPNNYQEYGEKSEVEYERHEVYKALTEIMIKESQEKITIYVISNLENASYDVIWFLKYLMSRTIKAKILFVMVIDKNTQLVYDAEKEKYDTMLEFIYNENYIFSYDYFEKDREKKQLEDNRDVLEMVKTGIECYNFFAYEEARIILTRVYDIFNVKESEINPNDFITILKILGNIAHFQMENENAMNYYNLLIEYAAKIGNKREVANGCIRAAILYRFRQNFDMMERMIIQSVKLAQEIDDVELEIKANLINYYNLSLKMYHDPKFFKEFFQKVERLKSGTRYDTVLCKFYNAMSIDYNIINSNEIRMQYSNEAIRLSKKLQNKRDLAANYHIRGLIYSLMGDNDNAFKYYKMSERIKKEIGNIEDIVTIYNGIGYGYFCSENYKKSIEYYKKALELLQGTNFYSEVALTFFNIAEVYFYSMNYGDTIINMNEMFSIMKESKIKNIQFHSFYEVYSILGIAFVKENNMVKGYEYIDKIKKMKDKIMPAAEFLTILFYATVKCHDKMWKEAEEDFQKAIEICKTMVQLNKFLPKLYYEYALMLKESGDNEKLQETLKLGREIAGSLGYKNYEEIFLNELQGVSNIKRVFNVPSIRFDSKIIVNNAKHDIIINKMNKRIDEFNFLNNLQRKLIEQEQSKELLIKEVAELINYFFVADHILFLLKDETDWNIFYSKKSLENIDKVKLVNIIEKMEHDRFVGKIDKNNEIFMLLNNEKENTDIQGVSSKSERIISYIIVPIYNKEEITGHIFISSEQNGVVFSEEDYKLLLISGKIMSTALANKELKDKLETKNSELLEVIGELRITQKGLIESEKMASLGSLVAGVSHEINTPLGIAITASSLLDDKSNYYLNLFKEGKLKRSEFEEFFNTIGESGKIIMTNLGRAAELVQSFKLVAVDQTIDENRNFALKYYISEVLLSLRPKFKNSHLEVELVCEEDLTIHSYPGAFYQIITNFINNSIIHAFEKGKGGKIKISVKEKGNRILFEYEDNGRGLTDEVKSKIFEPFFTTKRNQGGTGLGMSIVYNLVTQKLKGTIKIESQLGYGTKFIIDIPKNHKIEGE